MLDVDEVVDRKANGLVSCTCADYLHYAFCKHSYLIGKDRGIFLRPPITMCPIAVAKRRRQGRFKHIVKGGALDYGG